MSIKNALAADFVIGYGAAMTLGAMLPWFLAALAVGAIVGLLIFVIWQIVLLVVRK